MDNRRVLLLHDRAAGATSVEFTAGEGKVVSLPLPAAADGEVRLRTSVYAHFPRCDS